MEKYGVNSSKCEGYFIPQFINEQYINKNIMKKKSQIKKYSVEKIADLAKQQSMPETLTIYSEIVEERKKKLEAKRDEMLKQLNYIREDSEKIVYQMVDGVKDRLERIQKIVMSTSSRPSKEDVRKLAQLYSYMQNQSNLIKRNNNEMTNLYGLIEDFSKYLSHESADFTSLDTQFSTLQKQNEKQQIERNRLLQERDDKRSFYDTIKQTIEQYRIKYDIVESKIAQRERELDRLTSYYNVRQGQDRQKIQYQNSITNQLEVEMQKAQQILNANSLKGIDLQIKENQYTQRKLQGIQ